MTHVEGKIDPISDAETVETELMLADLESLEKRLTPLEKKAKPQYRTTARFLELFGLGDLKELPRSQDLEREL